MGGLGAIWAPRKPQEPRRPPKVSSRTKVGRPPGSQVGLRLGPSWAYVGSMFVKWTFKKRLGTHLVSIVLFLSKTASPRAPLDIEIAQKPPEGVFKNGLRSLA